MCLHGKVKEYPELIFQINTHKDMLVFGSGNKIYIIDENESLIEIYGLYSFSVEDNMLWASSIIESQNGEEFKDECIYLKTKKY